MLELFLTVRPNQTRVAYVENEQLVELHVERKSAPTYVGSIYKGRIKKVLPGMQAAFVDIGLPKAAFLYVGDIHDATVWTDDEAPADVSTAHFIDPPKREQLPSIDDIVSEGQMIMVQVAKDPLGTKGARVTTHISLPGRYVVHLPTIRHIGISRKITDEDERVRLRQELAEILNDQGGAILRTAGEGVLPAEIASDLRYLKKAWSDIQRQYDRRKSVGLVHTEMSLETRVLRDYLSYDVDRIVVDDPKAFKHLQGFVSQFLPQFRSRLFLHDGPRPLFDTYDIDVAIARAMDRKVWLKSGGYVVIDEAEALVAIDINTGKFVGKKDLEDTILKTNLEAVREIAYQLRLRNLGGIIIIDFIDMEREADRERVVSALKDELAKDRARTTVESMSALGLVEMTRKRTRPSLRSNLCEDCPYCEAQGYVKTRVTVAQEIYRSIERELASRKPESVEVRCHPKVMDWICQDDSDSLESFERGLKSPIRFTPDKEYHQEQFDILFS